MNRDFFRLHDVSDYPVVRLERAALPQDYAQIWVAEIEELVSLGQRFVLLFIGADADEKTEDRKIRTRWIKTNKERLSQTCACVIMVEPNPVLRIAKTAGAAAVAAAFKINIRIVNDDHQGEQMAKAALSGEAF